MSVVLNWILKCDEMTLFDSPTILTIVSKTGIKLAEYRTLLDPYNVLLKPRNYENYDDPKIYINKFINEIKESYKLFSSISGLDLVPPEISFILLSGELDVYNKLIATPAQRNPIPQVIVLPTVNLTFDFIMMPDDIYFRGMIPNDYIVYSHPYCSWMKNNNNTPSSLVSYIRKVTMDKIRKAITCVSVLEGTVVQLSDPAFIGSDKTVV
jgi:hypothetical protein